ncbi:major facilitator superfamily domain-containing protein [Rhodotorula diobovata]|uniref:Major facilitator superfamily domain-containing protein n=1 Tax=Rhodotorula diobovata TaxID=5288 RepID=A0A5C5G6N9_9BASI|nr:major facilitator superfamily domain-containing protein [Rhodotorula diobovata]
MPRFAEKPEEIPTQQVEYAADPEAGGPRFEDGASLAGFTTTTTEKAGSSKYADSTIRLEHVKASKANERKLVRKLDVLILPLAVLLYLSAYLDRGNLGNSKIMGIEEKVLKNVDVRYSIALCCFYITYILLSVPGTLMAKQFNPSTTIACGALIWSVAATCQAAVTNPAGLYVCRLGVGVGEAFFGQAMALYFTLWYTRKELSKRIGLFISAGALAGAFSGLISYGVAKIKTDKLEQYAILFLIEGLPSFLLAVVVYFFLPSRPERSKYLTEDQRTIACTRLNADQQGGEGLGIDWKAVRYTLTNWRTYVVAVAYSAMNFGLGSVSGFLPTIVKGLGYSNADAQLYTVPPYAVALVFMLCICTYSDRYQTRGIPIMSVFAVGIVGWALLLAVDPVKATTSELRVRYFAVHCVVSAGYAAIPLIMSWQAGNSACETQKAVSLGMLNSVGQCLSVAAAFAFPKIEGPRYTTGATVNVAMQTLGLTIALGMTLYYRWENRRRDKVEGGRPPKGMRIEGMQTDYDHAVGFRYTP